MFGMWVAPPELALNFMSEATDTVVTSVTVYVVGVSAAADNAPVMLAPLCVAE